jgi:DNA-binding NtrC family response regulator
MSQPDAALEDLANLTAATEALVRLRSGLLWSGHEGCEIERLLPLLARKAVAATKRALFKPPPPAEPRHQAPDDLLTRVANLPLREARAIFEAAYLAAQVIRCRGNVAAAAEAIGMERVALYRKLAKLDVAIQREPGRMRSRRKNANERP